MRDVVTKGFGKAPNKPLRLVTLLSGRPASPARVKQATALNSQALLSTWEQYMGQGLLGGRPFSQRTITDYMAYMRRILNVHQSLTIEVVKTVLLSIPAEMFATRDKCYKAMVCFGKFLIEENLLDESFLAQVKRYQPKRHLPPRRETVEEDNLAALINACLNATDLVVLQLMASTGLRASEVCHLALSDFDLDKGILNVRVSKWGRSRKVGLTPNMLEGIQGFMQAQGPKQPSDVMFTNSHGAPFNRHSLNKRLVRVGQRAGVKLHAHMLRRLFITSNANKGRPLQMIQMAAGHSSIVTTRNYMMTKEQEVIEAMQSWR